MNEEMEAEMTEMDSKNDHLTVTEEEIFYESIPINLRKERSTLSYKETMNMDVENVNTFETRKKVNTIKWRPIFEVIYEAYFKGSKRFSDDFMKECKDNSNEYIDIPLEVKDNIKRMAMEQGLYAQVVMLRQKDLKFVATGKIKNEAKFKFHNDDPILKYCQKSLNSCCLSSLASAIAIINNNKT